MKFKTTKLLAFFVSIMVAIFTLVILLLLNNFHGNTFSRNHIVIIPILLFFVTYLLFYSIFKKYIYNRISVIYKSIYDLKHSVNNRFSKEESSIDMLLDVEEEVKQWVVNNSQEMEQLKKMEVYRREFLGNVSHELKTPIFNIQGYIETLIEGGIEDKKINKKFLNKAAKNIDRLSTIIEDLEIITLIENDKLNLKYEVFDVFELIREIVDSLEMRAEKHHIKLELENTDKRGFPVLADKERISQVLINLLTNSIKYGKENGRTLVKCTEDTYKIRVEISDDGIGIEKKHLPRLFERFYRVDTDRSRKHGGSGLGLSIVKHIIEAHEQLIKVKSEVGFGSTFTFTLSKA